MFFGPFLPLVPFMFLLELLPESINNPIQTVILDASAAVLMGIESIAIAIGEFFGSIF